MTIKLRGKQSHGTGVFASVFIGEDADHLQLAGNLALTLGEWQLFGATLLLGAERNGGQTTVLPSEMETIGEIKP